MQGKLFVPGIRPVDFEGFFVREMEGTLEGKMEFNDPRAIDMRDKIYGSLINEDVLCIPHDGRQTENHLVLFHTKSGQHIDRVYWLSKIAEQEGFEGTYTGMKEECKPPYKVQDVRELFGWNVHDILLVSQGTKVELTLARQ